MRDHTDCHPGFSIWSEAWYAQASELSHRQGEPIKEQIMVGLYHEDGGTSGEFAVNWLNLGGADKPFYSMHLEVFEDGFSAMINLPGFISLLDHIDVDSRDGRRPDAVTVEQFVAELKKLGYRDLTARDMPVSLVDAHKQDTSA